MEPIERARAEDIALESLNATEQAVADAERQGNSRAADYYRDRRQDAMDDLRALGFFSDTPNA